MSVVRLLAAMTGTGGVMIVEMVHQVDMVLRQATVLHLLDMAHHLQVMVLRHQATARLLQAMEHLQATVHHLQAMVLLLATVHHQATAHHLVEPLPAMVPLLVMVRRLQVMEHLQATVRHLGMVHHQAMVHLQATAGLRQAMVDLQIRTAQQVAKVDLLARALQIRMALQEAKVEILATHPMVEPHQGAMHHLVDMALHLVMAVLLLKDPRVQKLRLKVTVVQADQPPVDTVLLQVMADPEVEPHRMAMQVRHSNSQVDRHHCQQDGSR